MYYFYNKMMKMNQLEKMSNQRLNLMKQRNQMKLNQMTTKNLIKLEKLIKIKKMNYQTTKISHQ